MLKRDGIVWVWGTNADGELGDGTRISAQRFSGVAAKANRDVFPEAEVVL